MVVSFKPWPLYPRYQFGRTVCVFQFLFACSLQYERLLPQSDIELSPLAVPTQNPVTELRLPQLNSSNGRTAFMFQILLIVQGRSWWRQQQLLTCCFDQGFEFGTWKHNELLATQNVRFSLVILCLYFLLLNIIICAHYTVYRLAALLFCLTAWRFWQNRRKWTAKRTSHLNAVCTAEDTPCLAQAVV
jgi:hypothetical protein